MKRTIYLAAITALMLSACGTNKKAAETTIAAETSSAETSAADETGAESSAEEKKDDTEAEQDAHHAYDVFSAAEGYIFNFTSGVGAWETSLSVQPDGAFSGQFTDFNMGEDGEGYEDGTVYACRFTGTFAEPELVSDTIWKTKVDALSYETLRGDQEQEYIEDQLLHILAEPYGFSTGAEFLIYETGTQKEDVAPEALDWLWWRIDQDSEALDEPVIYNVTNDAPFYPDHYAMGDYEYGTEDPAGYLAFRTAYEYQLMAEPQFLPALPLETQPRKYRSVTLKNLQGRWVNRYEEGGAHMEEILTVNGDYARIESYKDGNITYAWNGEGHASIEDRSDRNVCPAFRIDDSDGSNICTIYIRKVEEDHFVDGGFNCDWIYEYDDSASGYLQDSVTLENLQGVWYSEYSEGDQFYQVVLTVDGDHATLFETVNGEPSSYWNGSGSASIENVEFYPGKYFPELILVFHEGPCEGGTAGIYINNVDDEKFYDPGFGRWYWKITPENYW